MADMLNFLNLICVVLSSSQWLICWFSNRGEQVVWAIGRKLKLGLQT